MHPLTIVRFRNSIQNLLNLYLDVLTGEHCFRKFSSAQLVLGWVTVVGRTVFFLMQPKNRYRMTQGVRHRSIVN